MGSRALALPECCETEEGSRVGTSNDGSDVEGQDDFLRGALL